MEDDKGYWMTEMYNGGSKVMYMTCEDAYNRWKWTGLKSVNLQYYVLDISARKILQMQKDGYD